MRKNAFNAEERIRAINTFRITMDGKPFTKEQILTMFQGEQDSSQLKLLVCIP